MRFTLNDQITYWAPVAESQFGGKSYLTPVVLRGFWRNKFDNVINKAGQEIVSRAQVSFEDQVIDTGYLYHGVLDTLVTDPTTVDGAVEIRIVADSPNLASLQRLYTAYI